MKVKVEDCWKVKLKAKKVKIHGQVKSCDKKIKKRSSESKWFSSLKVRVK
jgi:hypothetical protein